MLVLALAAGIQIIHPKPAPGPLDNPMKGWCSYVDAGPILQPYSMAFFYVPWRELEPQKGRFEFATWEKKNWDKAQAAGQHIVFRVYVDYPGLPSGAPQWLRQEGVKFTRYSEYGGGESPDYNDPRMVEAMKRLIVALGRRYDGNPRVAFIEFGLMGFWGEWHTYPRTELFASEGTQRQVVDTIRQAFPTKKVMVRYPAGCLARQTAFGYFDDSFPDDTDGPEEWKFLPQMRASGRTAAWQTAPIGGEMLPHRAQGFLGKEWAITQKRALDAHFTWIGPYSPALEGSQSGVFRTRSEELVRRMGYQFRLDEIRIPAHVVTGGQLKIDVFGTNEGVAPFYYPWPVQFALLRAGRVVKRWTCDADIRRWLPGRFHASLSTKLDAPTGEYDVAIGVIDPWMKTPAIAFANSLPRSEGWTILGAVPVSAR